MKNTDPILFVPLYTEFFNAFKDGSKKIEYREYGPRWNEKTCTVGKKVILSKGYGKYERLKAVVSKFEKVGSEARIHMGNIKPIKQKKNLAGRPGWILCGECPICGQWCRGNESHKCKKS